MCAKAAQRLRGLLGGSRARHTRCGTSRSRRRSTNRTRRSTNGSRTASSTSRTTASTATSSTATATSVAIIFEADDGKVTRDHLPGPATSASAGSPTASSRSASRRATASSSTCRCRSRAVVAMQACARIGATHSVVFGGFSAKSLQERIVDAGAVAVITADEQMRGGKRDAAEGDHRRSARHGRLRRRSQRHRLPAHRRQRRRCRAGRDVWMHDARRKRSPIPASPSGSAPSIRCSSSTRRARPASRRACSTARAATCCGRC